MQVFYCINNNNLKYAENSIKSVLKFNNSANITIFSQWKLDTCYKNIVVDFSNYNFQTTDRLTKQSYFRYLIAQNYHVNKAIYLDADTICKNSLQQLYNIDVKYFGMAHSHDYGIGQADTIGHKTYFLDSVIIMNIQNLRKCNFSDNFYWGSKNYDFNNGLVFYANQTVINCCFYDLIEEIPLKWNFCYNRNYTKYNDAITIQQANIVHFIGNQKQEMNKYCEKLLK